MMDDFIGLTTPNVDASVKHSTCPFLSELGASVRNPREAGLRTRAALSTPADIFFPANGGSEIPG